MLFHLLYFNYKDMNEMRRITCCVALCCVALHCIFSVFNSTLYFIIFLTLVDEEGGFSFIRRMLSEGSIVALGSCSLHINDIIKYISIYRRFAMVSQILFYV